jgi:hypothetical protein
MAAGILVSFAVGGLFEFVSGAIFAGPHSYVVCAVVGATAALASQGAGGMLVGLIWGWLLGIIADAVTTQLLSDPFGQRIGTVLAWILSGLVGWLVGLLVSSFYRKIPWTHRGLRRASERLILSAFLASAAILGYGMGTHTISKYPTFSSWKEQRLRLLSSYWDSVRSNPANILLEENLGGNREINVPRKPLPLVKYVLHRGTKQAWYIWGGFAAGMMVTACFGLWIKDTRHQGYFDAADGLSALVMGIFGAVGLVLIKLLWLLLRLLYYIVLS